MLFRGLYLTAAQPLSSATTDISGLCDTNQFHTALTGYIEATIPNNLYNVMDDVYDRILAGENVPTVVTECSADYFIFNQYSNTDEIAVFLVDYNTGLKAQFLHPSYETAVFDAITGLIQNDTVYSTLPPLTVQLTGGMYEDSTTKQVVSTYPTIYTTTDGKVATDLAKTVMLVVGRTSSGNNTDLSPYVTFEVLEVFSGTLNDAIDRVTGKNTNLTNIVNENSQYVKLIKNLPIASKYSESNETISVWCSSRDILQVSVYSTYPVLLSKAEIYTYLSSMLEKFKNTDDWDIDQVVDAGLSTVMQYISDAGQLNFSSLKADIDSIDDVSDWKHVCDMFSTFCEERGDCVALLDAPRTLTLDGNVKKIRKTKPTNTFSSEIGKRLKNVSILNSSYSAMYLPWWKPASSPNTFGMWMPASSAAVKVYVKEPYYNAPAGLNYGLLDNIQDLSVKLNNDEAGIVYAKRLNYITLVDGVARLDGQKTMLGRSTAFDRMNVRRLFNFLKKNGRRILRYYVYEPNNVATRRRLVGSLSSMMDVAQSDQAVAEYMVICDETLNTPETIDQNELRAIVLVRPVKTVEFIKATFVANRTAADLTQVYIEMVTNGEFNW